MKKLGAFPKFCYGAGNLGYATVSQTASNFIMFFGTSVLGVSGTLVGLAVALSTFWDGISDPVVGHISDGFYSKRYGKRRGFMLVGTLGMILFNTLLWGVPMGLSEGAKFVWLVVSLLALETFCTIFSTPYVALGIDIAPDYAEQSRLQGFKTVFFILGMMAPSILMFLFMPGGQGQFGAEGYQKISYVTSTICLVAGLVAVFGVRRAEGNLYAKRTKRAKFGLQDFFKIFYRFFQVIKKPNFSPIIIGYSVALISTAFLSSVGLHLFTYAYHFSGTQIACLMGALFAGAILSQSFWIRLSNRIDKKPALMIALGVILGGICLAALTFLVRTGMPSGTTFWFVCVALLFAGFGTGALYLLPISMYADCITLERAKTGKMNTGAYSGFMTLAYNISSCLALLIIGVMLDLIRFNPAEPVQAMVVQNWLGAIVFGGCALAVLGAMVIFSRYRLKRKDVLKTKMLEK